MSSTMASKPVAADAVIGTTSANIPADRISLAAVVLNVSVAKLLPACALMQRPTIVDAFSGFANSRSFVTAAPIITLQVGPTAALVNAPLNIRNGAPAA